MDCLEGNRTEAERTHFGRRGFRIRNFWLQLIDALDQQEDVECDDSEADDRFDKQPVTECDRAGLASGSQRPAGACHGAILEVYQQVRKIHAIEQQTDRRNDHIVDEALDDRPECAAYDDPHGHVNDIAAHRELFEFLQPDSTLVC